MIKYKQALEQNDKRLQSTKKIFLAVKYLLHPQSDISCSYNGAGEAGWFKLCIVYPCYRVASIAFVMSIYLCFASMGSVR